MNSLSKGFCAEERAAKYLQAQGYKLVQRNYHCRYGEIDIICVKQERLIFCEVRYRSANQYSDACSSVTQQKQQRIIKTAQHFLNQFNTYQNYEIRFDVIGINGQLDNDINWLTAAFTL